MAFGSQQLGGSLGPAILVSIGLRLIASQVAHGTSQTLAATHGYPLIIKIAAAVMAVGAVIVALAFERVDFIPPDKAALEAAEAAVGEMETETAGGGLAITSVTDARNLSETQEEAS